MEANQAALNTVTDNIDTIAGQLCPEAVTSVTEIRKGGNSRIYKVETRLNSYALKRYPAPTHNDTRDRLHTEALALQCMQQHGIRDIPRVIATDREQHYSMLSWIDGNAITQIQDDDIPLFAKFLADLADMSKTAKDKNLPPASEACLSGNAILDHIEQRLKKLDRAKDEHAALSGFISKDLTPYIHDAKKRAQSFYQKHGLSFHSDLTRSLQVLIPSDFGGHNALRSEAGLIFLDFEYFGWDDPVTSTANFILHPAMSLSEKQKQKFKTLMDNIFTTHDPLYSERFDALLPLYAARWCSIILGEFIPERFAHRVQSGQYKHEEKAHVLSAQLAKAKAVIDTYMVIDE